MSWSASLTAGSGARCKSADKCEREHAASLASELPQRFYDAKGNSGKQLPRRKKRREEEMRGGDGRGGEVR